MTFTQFTGRRLILDPTLIERWSVPHLSHQDADTDQRSLEADRGSLAAVEEDLLARHLQVRRLGGAHAHGLALDARDVDRERRRGGHGVAEAERREGDIPLGGWGGRG